MAPAGLSSRPLDCALRDRSHILIMRSVRQFGLATETGKDADAAFDADVVVLLKQELVSPPRIGEAVLTFQALSEGLSVIEPHAVASSLEGVTNQQLTGLVSQIELLGAR